MARAFFDVRRKSVNGEYNCQEAAAKVADAVVRAGSSFRQDQKEAYRRVISSEDSGRAKWNLETILENACVAERNKIPLCDDTGIPHIFIEAGPKKCVTGELLQVIRDGVSAGLRKLPGRPMGIMGDDKERIDMSGGISPEADFVSVAPFQIKAIKEDVLRVHVLLLGGGPAIRGITHRVFHKHDLYVVLDEIVSRAKEGTRLLGCTPCALCIGIGRSQFEASSLMMEAMVYSDFGRQSKMEQYITQKLNETGIGPLGLNGKTTVLATFIKVGPQRASGVRVVALRPSCCYEPRMAFAEI
jgi:fumarate hydratase subunit alpha